MTSPLVKYKEIFIGWQTGRLYMFSGNFNRIVEFSFVSKSLVPLLTELEMNWKIK
jgi:hypothetical protein